MLPPHQALRSRRILSFQKYNLGSHVLVGLSSLPRVFFQTGRSGGWLLRILWSHHHLPFEDGDKGKCSPSSMMDIEIWRLFTGDIVHHGSLRWWTEVERERKGIIITWSQLAMWGSCLIQSNYPVGPGLRHLKNHTWGYEWETYIAKWVLRKTLKAPEEIKCHKRPNK